MKFETGKPRIEGRYVALVRCETTPEFVEPVIALWHGGKWHSWRDVAGWCGPIPTLKFADVAPETTREVPVPGAPQEFDL